MAIAPKKAFPQTTSKIGSMQILSSVDELFNHVDDGLPMWAEDGDRTVSVDIAFASAFSGVPAVSVGLSGIDSAHDQNLRFRLLPTKVTAKGFTIEFATWSDTHIARASVSWQAIGPYGPQSSPKPVASKYKAPT